MKFWYIFAVFSTPAVDLCCDRADGIGIRSKHVAVTIRCHAPGCGDLCSLTFANFELGFIKRTLQRFCSWCHI
jgi:hypothetical protein